MDEADVVHTVQAASNLIDVVEAAKAEAVERHRIRIVSTVDEIAKAPEDDGTD